MKTKWVTKSHTSPLCNRQQTEREMKRMQFADRLELLLRSVDGQIDTGILSDNSARWVNFRRGNKQICFSFNVKGDKLEGLDVFEDVVEVVSEKRIF